MGNMNLSNSKNRDAVVATRSVSSSQRIVFKPKGEVKHTVAVFTDIDCGYCRELHKHMEEYNARGIQIIGDGISFSSALPGSWFITGANGQSVTVALDTSGTCPNGGYVSALAERYLWRLYRA